MTIDRRHMLAGGLAALASPLSMRAMAQDYPVSTRPIRVVVPAVAGGGLDVAARVVVQAITEVWKQQAYVENRPGANWIIGMNAVAKAEPDGYTLLVVSNAGLSVNPLVFQNVPFDPAVDLTPVASITRGTFVLLVHPSVPAKTVPELIAYLKANPGKLNHGASSASTILLSEYFKHRAQVEFVNVTYRGGAQVITDTMAGTVQFCFSDYSSAVPGIQAGQLRPLAVTIRTRYELMPEVPPLSEFLPDFVMEGGGLLIAPGKTPREIIDKLHGVMVEGLRIPDVKQRLNNMGHLTGGATPEQVQEMLRTEAARWRALIKERNIRLGNAG